MPTQSTLSLVDALAEEASRVGASSGDDALRSQAAFVRALVDEVGRRHPSDHRMADLHGQLGGVDDFLLKPIDVGDLTVRLRAAEQLVRAIRVVQRVRERIHARSVRA